MAKIIWTKLMYEPKWLKRTKQVQLTEGESHFIDMIELGLTKREICEEIGICNSTIVRAVKTINHKVETHERKTVS